MRGAKEGGGKQKDVHGRLAPKAKKPWLSLLSAVQSVNVASQSGCSGRKDSRRPCNAHPGAAVYTLIGNSNNAMFPVHLQARRQILSSSLNILCFPGGWLLSKYCYVKAKHGLKIFHLIISDPLFYARHRARYWGLGDN